MTQSVQQQELQYGRLPINESLLWIYFLFCSCVDNQLYLNWYNCDCYFMISLFRHKRPLAKNVHLPKTRHPHPLAGLLMYKRKHRNVRHLLI